MACTELTLNVNNEEKLESVFDMKNGLHDGHSVSMVKDLTSLEQVVPQVDFDRDLFSRVLVIYTGGTIGMKAIDGGKRKE